MRWFVENVLKQARKEFVHLSLHGKGGIGRPNILRKEGFLHFILKRPQKSWHLLEDKLADHYELA